MVQLILWALLVLFPVSAQATTYYVATTGSDANSGTSEASPKLTVRHCVSIMVAGDTCYVRGGTYTETNTIRFGTTGTQANPIKLLAYPNESPVITYTAQTSDYRILIQNSGGEEVAMGWITISGFEIRDGYEGIKYHSLHNSTISNNWIHGNKNQGVLGIGGHHVVLDRNIINHNGPFDTNPTATTAHGIYLHGSDYTISNNLIYDNLGYGIQQNGSSSSLFSSTKHPSADFANAYRWIVVNNTFAYNTNRAGIVIWGSQCTDGRYENNIFYENAVTLTSGNPQGLDCVGCSGSTGIRIKNNHLYASGSGGQVGVDTTFNADLVSTGNVTNVSAPAFVNGGSNALPASPDFRLTALAPVNIALANEFPTNGVVGAFQPLGAPIGTITTNKIRLSFTAATAVPAKNLSTTGATAACTLANCPGALTLTNVNNVPNTDTQIEETVSGFAGDACASTNLSVTASYNSATGTWTGNDNIGPYPGLHQKILSFTSVPVTNQCTGSGPPGSSAAHITYAMENGSGTTVSDTSGNGLHATTSGTWVSGKTGFGINVASGSTQQTTIPYGNLVNPSTQDMTWVVPVFIPTGQTSVTRYLFGSEIGTDQRGYIGASSGTWRVARKNISISAAGASNLAVVQGWNHLCARWDSTTDTVTLYNNGVAGTGGATGSYTSYTFATNFEFPLIGSNLHTTVPEATFDDVQVFTSLQDCAALYAAWNAPPPPAAGTLAQAAIQFQGVILDTAGSPIVIGPSVQSIEVPAGGGAVILFQVHCTNVSDCDLTAFKLVYSKNGSSTWQQVPNTETADGTWMWGVTTDAHLNNGTRSTRLTGSCTVTTGTTQVTSAQTPSIDLPQDGCVVLGYIVRAGSIQAGNYFDYKLQTEAGLDFTTYTQTARMRVVNPMSSGIGF